MKNFSNKYIFLYITALVTVVALMLTMVSLGLKPLREANQKVEKAQQILKAAGYGETAKKQALALFDQVTTRQDKDGQEHYRIRCADGSMGQVIYVKGKGLWGPIWGYIILAEDNNTIKGVVFDHKSETPGLGARITEETFQQSFCGKKIKDKEGHFVSVRILPKGKEPTVTEEHRVDAISGATLTSKGVDEMMGQLIINN